MVALDKSYQEWAKLSIQAAEKGVELPPHPGGEALLVIAKKIIDADAAKIGNENPAQEANPQAEMMEQQPQQPMM